MKPEVSDLTGYRFRRADREGNLGLVDVTEPYLDFPQKPVCSSAIPGGMANFKDEGIFFESIGQFPDVSSVLVGIMKGIGKLKEKGAQSASFPQGGQAVFEGPLIPFGQGLSGMSEVAVELGGEFEPGIGLDPPGPALAHDRGRRAVEGVVELDGVEKGGHINQGIKLDPLLWRGIDNPFPILIRPPRRPDTDHKSRLTPRRKERHGS
jgi:hypothetical protein